MQPEGRPSRLAWPLAVILAGILIGSALAVALAPEGRGYVGMPALPRAGLLSSPVPDVLRAGAPSPDDTTAHWWEGAEYSGTSTTSTELSTFITVPDDFPEDTSTFFYVLLSAWDNAASYDQIGFAADDGGWGVTYSWTTSCAGTYNYEPDAFGLTRGTTYLFEMSFVSGDLVFDVDNSGGGILWTLSVDTGGSAFEVDTDYSCGGNSYGGLTDYEEDYTTAQEQPSWSFYFQENEVGGLQERSWSAFGVAQTGTIPSNVLTTISGANATVENEPFNLTFAHGLFDHVAVGQGTTSVSTLLLTNFYASDGTVTDTVSCLSTGWSATVTPGSGTTPFQSTLAVTLPANAALGTYCVRVTATDAGGLYTRILYNVTVETPVVTTLPTFSPATVDVGQITTVSTTTTGGDGIYSYYWSGVPTNCANRATSSFLCSPTVSGYYHVNVSVSDSLGVGDLAGPALLIVYPAIVAATPVANVSELDVGQGVSFTTTVSGGSGSYSAYTWTESSPGLGCTLASAPSMDCQPTSAFTAGYTVSLTVTDSNGGVSLQVTSAALPVFADPSLTALTASPGPNVDANTPLALASLESGGYGTLTYTWSHLPVGCTNADAPDLSCTPTSAGSYDVGLSVTDGNGVTATAPSLTVSVTSPPVVGTPVATPASIDLGGHFTLTSTVTGGAAPLSYTWNGLPTGCSGSGAATLTCTPTATGFATISLTVTDASGTSVTSGTVTISVWSPPTVVGPFSTARVADVGQRLTLNVTASGGSGALTFVWSGLPSGCATDADLVTCTFATAGDDNVSVTVTDPNGGSATSSVLEIEVHPLPTVVLSVSRGSVDVGGNLTFLVTVTGGAGGGTFEYAGLGLVGCSSADAASIPCHPTAAGTASVEVNYTDAAGVEVTSVPLEVTVDPALTLAGFTASPSTLAPGSSTSLSVTLTGGVAGFTYTYVGLPSGCESVNASSLTCSFPAAGSYTVSVVVVDASGDHASSSVVVVVSTASSLPLGTVGGVPTLLLVGIALAAIVLVAVLLVRRRRPKDGGTLPPPNEGTPPPPPPG